MRPRLYAARGEHAQTLPLLLLSLQPPSMITETKARAAKFANEIKTKLSSKEIDSAQRFASEHWVDFGVRQILTGSYQP